MHKFQCLLIFCLAAMCINGENGEGEISACGRRLIEMMTLVCGGNYNRPVKKAGGLGGEDFGDGNAERLDAAIECRNLKLLEQFNNENKRDREMAAQRARVQFLFQNRHDAFDFGHFARERRSSITSECCKKSCTMKEMQLYCGPRP